MLITHDMGVIAKTADRVAVMYAGRIAETGSLRDIIKNPKHPYTTGLMNSIPVIGQESQWLPYINGSMPRLDEIPKGCAFNTRCPQVMNRCRIKRPDLMPTGKQGQMASCWVFDKAADHA